MSIKNIYSRSISISDKEDYYIIKDILNESSIKNYIEEVSYDLSGYFMTVRYSASDLEHMRVESIIEEIITNYCEEVEDEIGTHVMLLPVKNVEDYYLIKDMIHETTDINCIISFNDFGSYINVLFCANESEHAKLDSVIRELLTNYYD